MILHSTLKELKAYDKAHELQIKEQDFLNWSLGRYYVDALSCTVGNMFARKGHKTIEYPKKPYLSSEEVVGSDELTEEEKIRRTKLLFARLEVMQHNFELNKKENKESDMND